ncbi:hypothetical protein MCG44_00560 [Lawsonibacter sp. OA9]|uniref:hypothetical protein n=1 Tax=Oscillospiraceae TaxID=216572 RepID=UPI001F05DCB6|nr:MULTISPECIES: hypothetical protein [Oscillospiraceae]MCH1978245.1 hypothetical protein [Lawsonibacter sp. OA9]MCH1984153.1 hypothetical protein [Ruminococcus sp. OA3]
MKLFKKRRKSLVDEMEKAFMEEAAEIEKEVENIDSPEDPEAKERMRRKILEEAMRTELRKK